MSSFGDRFRTDEVALWPLIEGSTSGYGDDYGAPIRIKVCQYHDGKMKRDRSGVEFMPRSGYDMGYLPNFGDMIQLIEAGSDLPSTPEGAETIRAIKHGTELRGAKDYLVFTG